MFVDTVISILLLNIKIFNFFKILINNKIGEYSNNFIKINRIFEYS